ncbi:MAG: Uncharacterised protein [Prochlorococcus marinus str. MIT 9313]|nr:MAG: Uncharacterised protein [Prochlorococcus marinus str. MIT 9313]
MPGLTLQKCSACLRSLGRNSIQAPLWLTSGLRLLASRSSSRSVRVTPPIMSSQLQSRVSPKVKPLDLSDSSALIARPRRLASPPERLAGNSTPTPTSRSWAAAVRTNTKASAGVSCIASGVALSRPRSIGANTVRARPMPSSSTSPGCSTRISPSCRTLGPAAQAAAAGTLIVGSASACKAKRSSQRSSPSPGVKSSKQALAGATLPATPSRQWLLAVARRSASSSGRLITPLSDPSASCQAVSNGSRPCSLASNPVRSWASKSSSSRLATRRRPLRGRHEATGLAARIASGLRRVIRLLRLPVGSRQGRAQVATKGS